MWLVMCRCRGEFVLARRDGDAKVVLREECPRCGEGEFVDNATGETVDTD